MANIECICPPRADGTTRHPDGDEVTLRAKLDFKGAATAINAVALAKLEDPDAGGAEMLAVLTEQYLLNGVESWTLQHDEKGKSVPLPVTKPNIRELLLANDEAARTVADEADGLYSGQVLVPLVLRSLASSRPTPKARSTSASQRSPSKPRKPSKRSSTGTTPTAGTGPITALRGSGSSSSRKAARQPSGTAA